MGNPYRRERLASEMAREIAPILLYELKDPRCGFLSVVRVEVAKDYKTAKVFVSVLGERKVRILSLEALKSAAGFINRELRKRIRSTEVPRVSFVLDESIEKTFRITKLIDEVSGKAKPAVPPPAAKEEE